METQAFASFVFLYPCSYLHAISNSAHLSMTLKELYDKMTSRYLWGNILAMILVIALIIFLTLKGLDIYSRHGEEVTVPRLKGMTYDEARKSLEAAGLVCVVADSGKGNTIMRTTLKDVVSGRVLEKRFNIGEALEDVRVERRPYQFSYADGDQYHFLNQETWDDVVIEHNLITGVDYMKEGDIVDVVSDASSETILYAEMPVKTVLKITYTEPGLKGDTATNATKPATVETGATVRVPLFINEGSVGLTSRTRNLFHKTLCKRGLAQLKEPGLNSNNGFYIPTRKLSGN